MEPTDPSPDKKYHHGNLRETLLRIARQFLEERGADAVGLREVARASGVSANAPYRHFADKEALLAAVAAQGFGELLACVERSGEGGTAEEKYLAGCRAYFDFATTHSAVTRLMFETFSGKFGAYPELKAAADACLSQFLTIVGARHGREPHGKEAFTHAIAVWSLLHGFATLKAAGALEFPRQDLLPTPEQLAAMIAPPPVADPETRPRS